MAKVYPDLQSIIKNSSNEEDENKKAEVHLLKFLNDNLDDSYDIFYQPFLNGDRPDIVVLREGSGVLLIEVKNWNLDCYEILDSKKWKLNSNASIIQSPFQQVKRYKEDIFNLHVENLLEKKISNPKLLSVVTCAVYFHNTSDALIHEKIFKPFNTAQNKDYIKNMSYYDILSTESLTPEKLKSVLHNRWLDRTSKLFDNDIYKSLKYHLSPPSHVLDIGKEIIYSPQQQNLLNSSPGSQKIKGVAGCGKTFVLAKRAVNAYKRTSKRVLILTFNISLRNYIHDRISEVREAFPWSAFHIIHYHEFFRQNANNYNLPCSDQDFSDVSFFETVKNQIVKYDSIFIDEGQDYEYEWFLIIKKYFLEEDGEFVVFADEKQNIYSRTLDSDKKTKTNIPGRWNETLKHTFRLSKDISNLANKFQQHFWSKKYSYDLIEINDNQIDFFGKKLIKHQNIPAMEISVIFKSIIDSIHSLNVHPNDVAVLSHEVEILRDLDYELRTKKHYNTTTTFETLELYETIKKQKLNDDKSFKLELDSLRRSKKFNFRMNPGTMKLSTVHSFKGWEIDTIFLLIPVHVSENNIEELIYTGITRAKNNLFIICDTNSQFHRFFAETNIPESVK